MTGRRRSDRGSAALLVPVGVLVVVILGGLTVDIGRAVAVQRSVSSRAVAVANDLGVLGIDRDAFLDQGAVRLRPEADLRRIAAGVGAAGPGEVTVTRVSDQEVVVEVVATVDPVFVPGSLGLGATEVHARATGTATLPD